MFTSLEVGGGVVRLAGLGVLSWMEADRVSSSICWSRDLRPLGMLLRFERINPTAATKMLWIRLKWIEREGETTTAKLARFSLCLQSS